VRARGRIARANVRTMAMLVAKPFATPSACLTTAATSKPPKAWLTTTLHTSTLNPCHTPWSLSCGHSGHRKMPAAENVRLETDSCTLRAHRLGELGRSRRGGELRLLAAELADRGDPNGEPGEGESLPSTSAGGGGAGALRTYSNQPPARPDDTHAARMAARPTRGF